MALRKAAIPPTPAAARPALIWSLPRPVLLALFLMLSVTHYMIAPLDRFDEGVTVTKAAMTAIGRVPYRDFWITYGPLDTYLLAAAFKLFAFNVMVERSLGALVMVLFATVTYALTRYIGLRPPMRFLMTGLISVAPLSLAAFNSPFLAVMIGLAALMAFLTCVDRPGWRRPALSGVLTGLVAFGRPEFAIALGAGLMAGYATLAFHPASRRPQPLLCFLACVTATGLSLWTLMIGLAGFKPIWFDIVTHATSLYAPGRSIPLGQGDDRVVVILLGTASVIVWACGAVRALRQRADAAELARLLALLVVAILAFTWVRTRADGIHAFEAWPLTCLLLALLLERRARRRRAAPARFEAVAATVGILLFCLAGGSLSLRDALQPAVSAGIPRAGLAGNRAWISPTQLHQLLSAIDAQAPDGQPIWVGLQRNDLVVFNDTMVYFLSGHYPGTAYYESFPGLTNTEAGERTIVCQLVMSGVTTVVLGPNTAPEPWNLSAVPGSTYLDRWLTAGTVSRVEIGPYSLLKLRPAAAPGDPCPASGAFGPLPGSRLTP